MPVDVWTEPMVAFCPACGQDCLVDTPPCPDGHGAGCPERLCLECGTALLTGPLAGLAARFAAEFATELATGTAPVEPLAGHARAAL